MPPAPCSARRDRRPLPGDDRERLGRLAALPVHLVRDMQYEGVVARLEAGEAEAEQPEEVAVARRLDRGGRPFLDDVAAAHDRIRRADPRLMSRRIEGGAEHTVLAIECAARAVMSIEPEAGTRDARGLELVGQDRRRQPPAGGNGWPGVSGAPAMYRAGARTVSPSRRTRTFSLRSPGSPGEGWKPMR